MILDKVLLLKGLGGLTACTGLSCGAAYLINPDLFRSNDQKLVDLISKVGLDCKTPSAAGTECTKVTTEGSKINIKQGSEATGKFEIDALPTSSGNGKIKLYKLSGQDTGYNKGLKFVIEDGDINLANSKKLEQFETYEIEEVVEGQDKKWYLTRKQTAIQGKEIILGLPNSCTLPTNENGTSNCSEINAEKLKAINFKDKDANGAKIATNGTVTLTITKVPSSETEFSTEGYKFSFNPNQDVTISTSSSIKIMKNTNTEFKIKKEGNTLTLEKTWTADALAKKAGLTGCESSTKECTLPTNNTLKLYNDSSDKLTNAKSDTADQKIKYQEDVEGHNQGFKFYVENEVTLADSKKIAGCSTATYEIKEHTEDSSKIWYLTKKATTGGGTGG